MAQFRYSSINEDLVYLAPWAHFGSLYEGPSSYSFPRMNFLRSRKWMNQKLSRLQIFWIS